MNTRYFLTLSKIKNQLKKEEIFLSVNDGLGNSLKFSLDIKYLFFCYLTN